MTHSRTRLSAVLGVVAMSLCGQALAQAADPLGDAIQLNSSRAPGTAGVTTTLPDANAVPGFSGADQPQTNYFAGGRGELVGPGTVRSGDCSSQDDPECLAVNMMNWGPDNRPKTTFGSNDSMLGQTEYRQNNAASVAGPDFATADGNVASILGKWMTVCKKVDNFVPAEYRDEICNESAQLARSTCELDRQIVLDPQTVYQCVDKKGGQQNSSCLVDREIKVKAEFDYQCQRTTQKPSTQYCQKARMVDVTWTLEGGFSERCNPGQWYNAFPRSGTMFMVCDRGSYPSRATIVVDGAFYVSNGFVPPSAYPNTEVYFAFSYRELTYKGITGMACEPAGGSCRLVGGGVALPGTMPTPGLIDNRVRTPHVTEWISDGCAQLDSRP